MKIPYTHGGDIYSHPVRMDYSANINPLGLPEGVKENWSSAFGKMSALSTRTAAAVR